MLPTKSMKVVPYKSIILLQWRRVKARLRHEIVGWKWLRLRLVRAYVPKDKMTPRSKGKGDWGCLISGNHLQHRAVDN